MSIQTSQLSGGLLDPAYYQQQQQSFQVSPQHIQRLRHLQQQAAFHQQNGLSSPPEQEQMLAMSHYQQPLPSTVPQSLGSHSLGPTALTSSDPNSISERQVFLTKEARRAEHNAIERARRESLNTKFQQLAHSLPNLQNDRRPSKGTIIERTLEFGKNRLHETAYGMILSLTNNHSSLVVKHTVQKEERYRNEIKVLSRANRQLMRQVTSRSTMLMMSQVDGTSEQDCDDDDQDDDHQFDMLDYEDSTLESATTTYDTLSRKSSISSFAMQSMSSLPTTIGSGSSTTTSPSLDNDPSVFYQVNSTPLSAHHHQQQQQQQVYFSDDFQGYMLSAASMDPCSMMKSPPTSMSMTNSTNLPIKYEPSYPC